MSILRQCIRYSWDVVANPPTSWYGVNDRLVADKTLNKAGLPHKPETRLEDKSPEFYRLSIPVLLILRNTQHPLILERNFFWDADPTLMEHYPKTMGPHLTSGQRDKVQSLLGIKPEHRFVLHLMDDPLKEEQFIRNLALTAAFTTYVIPSVCSLSELSSLIYGNNFGGNDALIEEYTLAPLLILTDVFGSCDKLSRVAGTVSSILKDRMYNGRTTVFCHVGNLHTESRSIPSPDTINLVGATKKSILKDLKSMDKNTVSLNATQLHPFFLGGMTYVMSPLSFTAGVNSSIE